MYVCIWESERERGREGRSEGERERESNQETKYERKKRDIAISWKFVDKQRQRYNFFSKQIKKIIASIQYYTMWIGSICFMDCLGLNQQGGQRYQHDASGRLAEPPSK